MNPYSYKSFDSPLVRLYAFRHTCVLSEFWMRLLTIHFAGSVWQLSFGLGAHSLFAFSISKVRLFLASMHWKRILTNYLIYEVFCCSCPIYNCPHISTCLILKYSTWYYHLCGVGKPTRSMTIKLIAVEQSQKNGIYI